MENNYACAMAGGAQLGLIDITWKGRIAARFPLWTEDLTNGNK
jgi:hypothetical protein